MDAVTAVTNDHRLLERLFEQLRADRENRSAVLAEARARLTAHCRAEEKYVYPAVQRARPNQAGAVRHATEEHRLVTDRLDVLESAGEQEFGPALAALVQTVADHVRTAESELLPVLTASVSTRKREDLGRRFEALRIRELGRAGIDDTLTKEDLYIRAQKAGIPGRSSMSKGELARALLVAGAGRKRTGPR